MQMRVRRSFLLALGAAVALWLLCPFAPVVVLGGSMEPTLRSGQVVLMQRGHYRRHALRRGDVVVFRHDGTTQVKRVHALPGDRVWQIRFRDSGSVFLLDPEHLALARELAARPGLQAELAQRRVPEGTVYVIGDGGNASFDSRYYGPVPSACIRGRVLLDEDRARASREAAERAMLCAGNGRRHKRERPDERAAL